MSEDLGDAHSDHREAEIESVEVLVEDEGMFHVFEGFNGNILALNKRINTLRTATAPLFLYESQYLGAEKTVRVNGWLSQLYWYLNPFICT